VGNGRHVDDEKGLAALYEFLKVVFRRLGIGAEPRVER